MGGFAGRAFYLGHRKQRRERCAMGRPVKDLRFNPLMVDKFITLLSIGI
jgi:hypothetical protein